MTAGTGLQSGKMRTENTPRVDCASQAAAFTRQVLRLMRVGGYDGAVARAYEVEFAGAHGPGRSTPPDAELTTLAASCEFRNQDSDPVWKCQTRLTSGSAHLARG
jgi:hypothetical protein